jgi:hypothetical protein
VDPILLLRKPDLRRAVGWRALLRAAAFWRMRVLTQMVVLSVALAMTACGPTGGGTGTGESSFAPADFGARAVSACSAPFADSLTCVAVSIAPADVPNLAGTASTHFAADTEDGSFTLTLRDNRADLQARCRQWSFVGAWGVLPAGEGRYFGSLFNADVEQQAQLQVQAAAGPLGRLQVQVLDVAGQVVVGPLMLQRVDALPVGSPVCP